MTPRLHAVIDVIAPDQAVEWAHVALGAEMDGVFLISHAHDDDVLVASVRAVRSTFAGAHVGVNVIGRSPADSLQLLLESGVSGDVDALWTDNAGLDLDDVEVRARAFTEAKAAAAWGGIQFGGVAFEHQPSVDPKALASLAARAARHVEVVTTSGGGTGQAIDAGKLAAMHGALRGHPLALASGVTPENIREVRDHADHILVSTGIKGENGKFDVDRIKGLRRAAV